LSLDVQETQHSLDTKGLVMLVLSRKPGEKILIGDNVAVTIVRIGPNSVRLGIEAPRDMNIVREELCVPLTTLQPPGAPAPEPNAVPHEV
jgi:carbon storage regulator